METVIDTLDQFGCGVQIYMGGFDIHMAHVSGQPGQARVNVRAVPVPLQKPVNRERMAQVMDAWAAILVIRDAALFQQVQEGGVDRRMQQQASTRINEKR